MVKELASVTARSEGYIMFNPGPVTMAPSVRQALLQPDIYHRGEEFRELLTGLRRRLLPVFGGTEEHAVVVLTGSGTMANETVVASVLGSQHRALLIDNGEFGGRLQDMLELQRVPYRLLRFEWGEYPDPDRIETELRGDPTITHIILVAVETSTGMRNPYREVGDIARRHGKVYIVDGISAVGGEDIDVARDGIDFCTVSANKCLAAAPGVAAVCARRDRLMELQEMSARASYLDLARYLRWAEDVSQTPFTPSIPLIAAFNEAVRMLLTTGLTVRRAGLEENVRLLRSGLEGLGFGQVIPLSERRAVTITNVHLPPGLSLDALHTGLLRRGLVIVGAQKRYLRENRLAQFATMGHLQREHIVRLLTAVEDVLAESRNFAGVG